MKNRTILLSLLLLVAFGNGMDSALAWGHGFGCSGLYHGPWFPVRSISYGAHPGIGWGYPGLYSSYLGLDPYPGIYSYSRSVYPWTVVLQGARQRRHSEAREARATDARPAVDYREIVERARKLYPRGVPGIEAVWSADGVTKIP